MEGFVEDIFDPTNIPVIDSSTGIPLLSGTSHSHEEDDGHNHDHSHRNTMPISDEYGLLY